MRALFREYVIKAQIGTNFNMMKYTKLNRILVSACAKYYHNCQIRRNKMLHDEAKQRIKIINWYKAEREMALNGE